VELSAEVTAYSITNSATAYASPYKFVIAGFGVNFSSSLFNMGASSYYWSSVVSGSDASYRSFSSGGTGSFPDGRANGFSVRCIKD
jgi:hypothetical protein